MPNALVVDGSGNIIGGGGGALSVPVAGGPAYDPFPRTYIYAIGGNKFIYASGNTNAGVPFSTVVSQSNIVTVSFYPGLEATLGTTSAALMSSWKTAASANGVTLRTSQYTSGLAQDVVNASLSFQWMANALNNSSMWAYTSAAGSGGNNIAFYNGYSPTSGTIMIAPANTQTVASFTYNGKTGANVGLNLWQNYVQYYYDLFWLGVGASKYGEPAGASNAFIDAMFFDNMLADASQMSTNATWNGLGTTPVGNTATTQAGIQQGDAKLIAAMRALNPNLLAIGNASLDTFGNPSITVDPSYQHSWDVVLNELVIGFSFSIESFANSPPGNWMNFLIQNEQLVTSTGTQVLHQVGSPNGVNNLTGNQSTWTATQWQSVRFGIAAAMQRNYHYALNCGQNAYSSFGLLDEQVQTVNGSPNYGWLSAGTQRLDPPQSGPGGQGNFLTGTGDIAHVWVRRYPNGWVLWKPRTNAADGGPKTATVNVPTTLHRITTRGYGDATVNTGAQITGGTVTIQDADGLFLIGTG